MIMYQQIKNLSASMQINTLKLKNLEKLENKKLKNLQKNRRKNKKKNQLKEKEEKVKEKKFQDNKLFSIYILYNYDFFTNYLK